MEKLDLHGLTYELAESETIRFIEKFWDEGKNLQIITGHSSQMKLTVIKIINEYDLEYRIGDLLGLNNGQITILNERRW